MNIDTPTLKESELGKVILFYSKCKRVDPTIKRLADTLVSKYRFARILPAMRANRLIIV
jgi:hypothetical protein